MGLGRVVVEVVSALAETRQRVRVELEAGATVRQALAASRLAVPGQGDVRVGVFGRLRALDDAVEHGDRVELYRPLLADPKAARRERAARHRLKGAVRPG